MNKIERLILVNQYEILQQLNLEENEYYTEKIEIIKQGYEVHYKDLFNEIKAPMSSE